MGLLHFFRRDEEDPRDPALTSLLKETWGREEAALADDPTRTARVMAAVEAGHVDADALLRDPSLTSLLHDGWGPDEAALAGDTNRTSRIMAHIRAEAIADATLDDPALAATLREAWGPQEAALVADPARTARIMGVIQAGSAAADAELGDSALTALLADAYDDDPALAEAPGRTTRIMRRVLASSRPAARPAPRWTALAWATGTMATAAAAVLLFVITLQPPAKMSYVPPAQPVQPIVTVPASAPPDETPVAWPRNIANVPDVTEQPRDNWQPRLRVPESPPETPDVTDQESVHLASALYSAGKAARAAGDHEAALAGFEDSYEILPTPDALLASGEALMQLGDEELDLEG